MSVDWSPLWLSLRVAGIATTVSLALGLWLGWRRWQIFVALQLALPPTILCSYFLFKPLSWVVASIAGIVYAVPFLARSCAAAFQSVDPVYRNAARSLGASEWRLFLGVALPMVYRTIAAAAAIAFARILTEYAVTFLLDGRPLAAPVTGGIVGLAVGAIVGLATDLPRRKAA
ncbi:MAG: ABC transporter permease subunit [Candidatus Sulfopaludibacter sp.]|nr:ABC transporter permease subunit [Candidatus Sulfopaludibacter sp.]